MYSGHIVEKLWPIAVVRDFPLEEGHTFPPNKVALQLHIVEEANLCAVWIKLERSDNTQVCVFGLNGDPFIVSARHDGIRTKSWVVQTCIMRSG